MYKVFAIALAFLLCILPAFGLESAPGTNSRQGLSADGEKKLTKLLESAADTKTFEAELDKLQLEGTTESVLILTYAMVELPWIPELEPKSRRDRRMPKIALEAVLDKLIPSTEHEKLSAKYFRAVRAGAPA